MRFLLFPISIIHYLVYLAAPEAVKRQIDFDVAVMRERCKINKGLMYWLVYRKPYRNLFYYRIPKSRFLKYLLPEYPLFTIVRGVEIDGGAFVLNHPYGTIINAKHIGERFTCCHLTTIGNGRHGDNSSLPTIGNNVSLGANVTIIGDVSVGNNVIVGAGCVVVKDIPDNCVVVGNPGRVVSNNVTSE